YMGKERIIAETGAGQHGTAVAMACSYLDIDCEIYMGRTDINRQRPNVFRMLAHDARVNPVEAGSGTLKEAINATLRDWATNVEDTHYVIGSVVGPHPFPSMVRDFQSVISTEAREQLSEQVGELPGTVIACAGGGSNTMGAFQAFLEDDIDLIAAEAGGSGLTVDEDEGLAPHSASLTAGTEGMLHGARTKLLQTGEGQIVESHSVSAGLDYAGVGPELSHLVDRDQVSPVAVDDDEALVAFHRLSQLEGIIPALESAHALGYLERLHQETADVTGGLPLDGPVLVVLSGRGDKDLDTVIEETDRRDIDVAPDMEVFDDR
ncbi:MAG: tryptophan synthase subunit beta, partial [Halodesulfurarchaeum sp.]